MRGSVAVRLAAATAGLVLAAMTATACTPDPAPGTSTSADAISEPSTSAPSPTPTATATPSVLPATCEELYPPATLAALQQTDGPLNDPGMQLLSTQIADALEVLESGIPTLRCTWGGPSGKGFSTNASLVDADQAARVQEALQNAGFSCMPLGEGTLCSIESKTVDLDDNLVTRGESQYFGGGVWVTTAWVGTLPEGYTQDVVQTLDE